MKKKCLVPECLNRANCRGLCICCYHIFRKRLRAGKIKDADVVKAGLILPAKAKTSKVAKFDAAFGKRSA